MVDVEKVFGELEGDAVRVQGFAREVVAKRASIVAAVTTVLLLLTNYGFGASGTVTHWLDIAFTVAGFIATVGVVRPVVTPVTDPRTDVGEKLVPITTAKAAVVQAVASEKAAQVAPVGDAGLGTVTPQQ